jgi:hypothetical protein
VLRMPKRSSQKQLSRPKRNIIEPGSTPYFMLVSSFSLDDPQLRMNRLFMGHRSGIGIRYDPFGLVDEHTLNLR